MRKTLLAALLVGASAFVGYAIAQTQTPPKVQQVNSTADLIQVIPGGRATAQSVYGTAAQVTAVSGYHDLGTVTTDPAYTAGIGVWNVFGHGTGTITAVTITTPANPGDGQRLCYLADQTTSTLTFAANNSTQTVPTAGAGVANTSSCITFNGTTRTWKQSN